MVRCGWPILSWLLVYLSPDEMVSCDEAGSVIELKNIF
jgi:hypothetical protein